MAKRGARAFSPPYPESKLKETLAPLEGATQETIKATMDEIVARLELGDLEIVSDQSLLEEDTVQKSRLAYVVSLLRFLEFLRKKAPTWNEAESQAKLGLAYIKHVEGHNMTVMQLGRNTNDGELVKEVDALRKEMAQMADKRVEVLATKRGQPRTIEATPSNGDQEG